MPNTINYHNAVNDFKEARRKAEQQTFLNRVRGESNELLSYETVRQAMKAVEGNQTKLKEIPLDVIIGSVGKYSDFTRDFLPLRDTIQDRWANIMEKAIGLEGLPPIEVYKIGDAYFVQDGNHRVSVARQLKATHIQAYVTEVRTRIPLPTDIQPDQLIILAEKNNFFEHTKIDQLRPDADLELTVPGQYPILEEHISVHQYFMGIDERREISYEEAVSHWYDHVYLPVVDVIREHQILDNFPNRTETDLYLWISSHRADLENELGWKIDTPQIADDLVYKFSPSINTRISKIANRILDIVIPDPLEAGPPAGHWRKKYVEYTERDNNCLFKNILVPLGKDTNHWYALDQALVISKRESAHLHGLHVIPESDINLEASIHNIQEEFYRRCREQQISGELAIDVGGVAHTICERAHWADIIVTLLAHPPGDSTFQRMGSGFRTMIRKCPRPVLAVPGHITNFNHLLLAYSSSPKAKEALYVAAYMAGKWHSHLSVLTISEEGADAEDIQVSAKEYLKELNISAEYHCMPDGNIAKIIIQKADYAQADIILMGGYKAIPLVELVLGSVVDQVLRDTLIPVLICR